MPGYEEVMPDPPECPTLIVHGWRDDVVPWQGSVRYGVGNRCTANAGRWRSPVDCKYRYASIDCLPVFSASLRRNKEVLTGCKSCARVVNFDHGLIVHDRL